MVSRQKIKYLVSYLICAPDTVTINCITYIVATKRKYQGIRRQWRAEGKEGYEEQTERDLCQKEAHQTSKGMQTILHMNYINITAYMCGILCTGDNLLPFSDYYITTFFTLRNFLTGNLWYWKKNLNFGKIYQSFTWQKNLTDSDANVVIEHKIPGHSKGYQLQLCQ